MSTPPSSGRGGSRSGSSGRAGGPGARVTPLRPTLPTGNRIIPPPPVAATPSDDETPAAANTTAPPAVTPPAAPAQPAPAARPAVAGARPTTTAATRPAGPTAPGARPAGAGTAAARPAGAPSAAARQGMTPARPGQSVPAGTRPPGAPVGPRPGQPTTTMPPRPGQPAGVGAPRPAAGMPPRPGVGAPARPGTGLPPRPGQPAGAGVPRPGGLPGRPGAPGGATTGFRPSTGGPGRPGGGGRPHGGRSNFSRGGGRGGPRSARAGAAAVATQREPVQLPAQITVKDLADLLNESAVNVIRELMTKHGVMANINQTVDRATAEGLVTGMGYEVAEEAATSAESAGQSATLERLTAAEVETEETTRPPIITVMGHVDHGKTTLLDAIRQTNVASGEAGGITQHIGAYQVERNGERLTFIDTPGHEAFTAMRARGAQVTDLAIIVVAADDGVQPQTIEAINHAKAAKVPIVVAINKIDAAGANVDRVKQQLADNGVIVEDWGGDVPSEAISARQKTGVDDLLDLVVLAAQLQDLKADPDRPASGVIIETKLDRQVGPVATALVRNGTLKLGDSIVAGPVYGRVRTMLNDRGKPVRKAEPATPVSIVGLSELPSAGDNFTVVPDERTARTIAEEVAGSRVAATPEKPTAAKELNVIIKGDVQGTLEAIRQSVIGLGNAEVAVNVIHGGVGNISESDILLAIASKALVVGFNIKVEPGARRAADQGGVDVRLYDVIYDLLEDLEKAVSGLLEPVYEERITGHAEVRQVFRLPRNEVVAGCQVTDGVASKAAQCRVLRRGSKVYEGKVASLRRFKDAVNEVTSGSECGVALEDWRDVQIGDVLEFFGQERVR